MYDDAVEKATMQRPDVNGFFHKDTFSIAYLVTDPATKQAAIIDPVLDYDEKAGRVSTTFADMLLEAVKEKGVTVEWILDTHPHADHFFAAPYLKEKLGAPIAIGEHVNDVQALWKGIYNLPDFPADGTQWDRLFADGDTFKIGSLEARVMFSPGHTLASITYVIGDAAFVHDTLFQPDFGTARADFPGGDAATLYRSIQAILALPDETRLFTGHDYMPGGREPRFESTVGGAEAREPASQRQHERGGFRGAAQQARRGTPHAAAHPLRAAGQHERRPPARAGRQTGGAI